MFRRGLTGELRRTAGLFGYAGVSGGWIFAASSFGASFRCASLGNGDLNGRDNADDPLSKRRRFAWEVGDWDIFCHLSF